MLGKLSAIVADHLTSCMVGSPAMVLPKNYTG